MRNTNGLVVHIPFTNRECSCGQKFEFETILMEHVDKYMPPDDKKKQMDLFE